MMETYNYYKSLWDLDEEANEDIENSSFRITGPDKSRKRLYGFQLATGCMDKMENIIQFVHKQGINLEIVIKTRDKRIYYHCELGEIFQQQIICNPRSWPMLFPSQSTVAQCCSHHETNNEHPKFNRKHSDLLPDDVLLQIFEYLDVLDLNNCEMVGLRWRNLLLHNSTWRKLLYRKSKNCQLWRSTRETVELVDNRILNLEPRSKCKLISYVVQIASDLRFRFADALIVLNDFWSAPFSWEDLSDDEVIKLRKTSLLLVYPLDSFNKLFRDRLIWNPNGELKSCYHKFPELFREIDLIDLGLIFKASCMLNCEHF